MLQKLRDDFVSCGGQQFRPKAVEFPTRQSILKRIQAEENFKTQPIQGQEESRRSARLTGSLAINMGLDLEMKQYVEADFIDCESLMGLQAKPSHKN